MYEGNNITFISEIIQIDTILQALHKAAMSDNFNETVSP